MHLFVATLFGCTTDMNTEGLVFFVAVLFRQDNAFI